MALALALAFVVVVMVVSAAAAAARELGLTGGGMTALVGDIITNGVVNIFPGDAEPGPEAEVEVAAPPPW